MRRTSHKIYALLSIRYGDIMTMVSGKTSDDKIIPLLVDSAGRVIVQTISGLSFAPMARSARYENLNLAGGTNAGLVQFTVTTGETWEINVLGMRYIGTVAGVVMNMFVDKGGVLSNVFTVQPPVTNKYEFVYLALVMDAGDILKVTITGATAGDDFVGVMSGRRIG